MKAKYYSGSFDAPWSSLLMWISWGSTLLMMGISITPLVSGTPHGWIITIFLNAVWMMTALFTVKGYRLQDQTLYIQRLLWETKLELQDMDKAYVDPQAFHRGFKTFGNGGLFSFSGYYRSKKLGNFRCWVTDQKRAVVLEIKGKKLVISPDSPDGFLAALGLGPDGK